MEEERTGPTDLSVALSEARDRLDEIAAGTRTHFMRLLAQIAPLSPENTPVHADGTACPPAPVDLRMLRRAALYASEGLTGDQAKFTPGHTAYLANLGRDLRKFGVTMQHYEAAAEAAGRAVCESFGFPYPGADLTYRRAGELGIPDGLTELLQAVDNAVRIVALGAVEDDEAGVPASLSAEVLEVVARTARTTVVRLRASSPDTGWAGQTLEVHTPAEPDVWHQLASALPPNDAGYLEFHCTTTDATADTPQVGETWVVANPTGGLGVPDHRSGDVLMIAVDGGLAALRALVLELSNLEGPPTVSLYWGVDSSRDLHGLDDLRGLERGFPWFTFTPVVLDEDHVSAAGAATAALGAPAGHGRRIDGVFVLISGDDDRTVREEMRVLTDAGVDPEQIIAEP